MIPLALGSLGLAIPLIGHAGGLAGVAGVIAVCIAIVLVNLLWVFGRDSAAVCASWQPRSASGEVVLRELALDRRYISAGVIGRRCRQR